MVVIIKLLQQLIAKHKGNQDNYMAALKTMSYQFMYQIL